MFPLLCNKNQRDLRVSAQEYWKNQNGTNAFKKEGKVRF